MRASTPYRPEWRCLLACQWESEAHTQGCSGWDADHQTILIWGGKRTEMPALCSGSLSQTATQAPPPLCSPSHPLSWPRIRSPWFPHTPAHSTPFSSPSLCWSPFPVPKPAVYGRLTYSLDQLSTIFSKKALLISPSLSPRGYIIWFIPGLCDN